MRKEKKIILRYQLEKRQPIICSAEKEIYENINQCLCLVRLQLVNVDLDDQKKTKARISEASLLIGQAVKDLRNLAKQLSVIDDNF